MAVDLAQPTFQFESDSTIWRRLGWKGIVFALLMPLLVELRLGMALILLVARLLSSLPAPKGPSGPT
jgi:hypothetical protein